MNRTFLPSVVLLAAMLLSAGLASEQKYAGPRCVGLYCLNRDAVVSQLLKRLGPAPPRSSEFAPYCYESKDHRVFLYLRSAEAVPPTVDAIFLGDFPNCLHMPTALTTDDLNAWRTTEGIGLGSSEQDVLHAYGKPSKEAKPDAKVYRELVKGYQKGDTLPDVGDKELQYGAGPAVGDLSLAKFGIRNGKVSYIWLSYSD
ncbi:MAG: hypothetical protein WB711_23975 [Terriglobales bacterium]